MSWMESVFQPRGVAVIGSVSPGKLGSVLVEQILDGGYEAVYAVNPKGQGDLGGRSVPAATSVQALADGGASIEQVIVASPAATVASVLEDAGSAGVSSAIVITAGFSETGNAEEERELLRIAKRHGIRLVGPNCAGIVNTKHAYFPTLETRPPVGDVAFVSQSGALGGAVLSWAEAQGVGFSKFVSYGNGADLTDIDFLDALREDGETRVVCLYVETVSDGRRFMESASKLAQAKPMIVIKAGRSDAGGRATQSHTGSMAGSDAVYDAALGQCGAIRVDGLEEMFDLCRAFTSLPMTGGRRLAIVTNSGGPGVLAADRAEALGLDVAPPSADVRAALESTLPSFCGFENPFDLTVQGDGAAYRDTIRTVAAAYDAVLALNVNVPYLDAAPLARGIVEAARSVDVPVVASFLAGRTVETAMPVLAEGGVPVFATGERAVAALASMARRAVEAPPGWKEPDLTAESVPWSARPTEPDAMDWLAAQGIPMIDRRFAQTEEEALAAAASLGYPVVLKVVSDEIIHKTDAGGVALDLTDVESVSETFGQMSELPGFAGVLVTPMVEHPVEAIVGLSRDPQFGPVVAVGLGGVYAEALRDVALRVAPIDEAEARHAIESLRGGVILRGMRGRVLDVRALAQMVAWVSELGTRYPAIAELDLNPVFVDEEGCFAADARVLLTKEGPTKGAAVDE